MSWAKDDYQAVADFLRQQKQKDPQNRSVNDAFAQADRMSRVQVAVNEASKEIEQTKKEIQNLKTAPSLPSKSLKRRKPRNLPRTQRSSQNLSRFLNLRLQGAYKEETIAKLEQKLATLTEQLLQLEVMKKEFEEERKKSEALAKELEQKQHDRAGASS